MTAQRLQHGHGSLRRLSALAYVAPALVAFGAFGLWPLIETVALSFQHWDGVTAPSPAGLSNYREALTDPDVRRGLLHVVYFIAFYTAIPISIALLIVGMIARVRVRGLTVFRTLFFIPQVLPMVVVAVAWRWMYATDGPINQLLDAVGLDGVSRSWLGDFTYALPSVGVIATWVTFGLVFVLFVAGVQAIPIELYEAARIDGASLWAELRHVTIPGIRGQIVIATVITMTNALRNFDIIYVTTGGGPGTSTTVPSLFIYRAVFQTREVGLGAAIGLLLMAIMVTFNLAIMRLRRVP